jgi:hypothetical protein
VSEALKTGNFGPKSRFATESARALEMLGVACKGFLASLATDKEAQEKQVCSCLLHSPLALCPTCPGYRLTHTHTRTRMRAQETSKDYSSRRADFVATLKGKLMRCAAAENGEDWKTAMGALLVKAQDHVVMKHLAAAAKDEVRSSAGSKALRAEGKERTMDDDEDEDEDEVMQLQSILFCLRVHMHRAICLHAHTYMRTIGGRRERGGGGRRGWGRRARVG